MQRSLKSHSNDVRADLDMKAILPTSIPALNETSAPPPSPPLLTSAPPPSPPLLTSAPPPSAEANEENQEDTPSNDDEANSD